MPRASKTGVRGLYRDEGDRYRIDLRWRDPVTGDHRRHRERLPARITALAAKERARKILASALAGDFDPNREAPKRLQQLVDAYLPHAEARSPGSMDAKRSHVKVIRAHLGDPLLDSISVLDVERLKRDYKKGGRTPATVNRVLATLKHMVRIAADWGWIDPHLASQIRKVQRYQEPPERVRYLTEEERAALLAEGTMPDWLRPIVMVALLTGMRLGEILALRVDHIDLAQGVLRVEKSKNGRSRWIPINDSLAEVLTAALAERGEGRLFVTRTGRPRRSDGVSRAFARIVEKAGIVDFHFHDTRHDFASGLRRQGVQLDVIQKLLGHRSLAMTQRYAHLGDPALRDAVATRNASGW